MLHTVFVQRLKWPAVAALAVWIGLGPRCPWTLAAPPEAKAADEESAEKIPPALEIYLGRRIAPTMSHLGADWLVRETRAREENPGLLLDALGLQPGMVVADMGCGNGFYSLKLARRVGPKGRVLAVDIQREMLDLLKTRARRAGLPNIEPILGTVIDPKLPEGQVDMALLVDVYHEFSHPVHMLAAIRKSLAPGGVLVLVEFRAEDPEVPIKELHKMSKQQMHKEMTANGFKLVRTFDDLPWQHVMFFAVARDSNADTKRGTKK